MSQDPGAPIPLLAGPGDRVWIRFRVNGVAHELDVEPRELLSDVIRHRLGLTGTHVGCEHGVCGACTIRRDGELVRSCLMLAVQVDGSRLETIEGVGDGERLDAVQSAFREHHGLQCGFCTPAFVLTAQRLLEQHDDPSEAEIREYLSGNICRCTGYVGIVDAVRAAREATR